MKVILTSFVGPHALLDVEPRTTVRDLKNGEFFRSLQVPENTVRFLFRSVEVDDDTTLDQLGAEDNCVLHIVQRPSSPYDGPLRALRCVPSTAEAFEEMVADVCSSDDAKSAFLDDAMELLKKAQGELTEESVEFPIAIATPPNIYEELQLAPEDLSFLKSSGCPGLVAASITALQEAASSLPEPWKSLVLSYASKVADTLPSVELVKEGHAEELVVTLLSEIFNSVTQLLSTKTLSSLCDNGEQLLKACKERVATAAAGVDEQYGSVRQEQIHALIDKHNVALKACQQQFEVLRRFSASHGHFRDVSMPRATADRIEAEKERLLRLSQRAMADKARLARTREAVDAHCEREFASTLGYVDALNHEKELLERLGRKHLLTILGILKAEEERFRRVRRTEALLEGATKQLENVAAMMERHTEAISEREMQLNELVQTNESFCRTLDGVSEAAESFLGGVNAELAKRKREFNERRLRLCREHFEVFSSAYPLVNAERRGAELTVTEEKEVMDLRLPRIQMASKLHQHRKVDKLLEEQEESALCIAENERWRQKWEKRLSELDGQYRMTLDLAAASQAALSGELVGEQDTPDDEAGLEVTIDGERVVFAHPRLRLELEETQRSLEKLEMEMEEEKQRMKKMATQYSSLQDKMKTLSCCLPRLQGAAAEGPRSPQVKSDEFDRLKGDDDFELSDEFDLTP